MVLALGGDRELRVALRVVFLCEGDGEGVGLEVRGGRQGQGCGRDVMWVWQ